MKKIVIVDDSPTARKVIERLLEPMEMEVIHGVNGVDGIRKILRHHPDLVTMDLNMPILNGVMTLRLLKLLELRVPVILVAGEPLAASYHEQFPCIFDVCMKVELREHLLKMARQAVTEVKRSYSDVDYTFTQNEFKNLVSESGRKRILIVDDSKTMRDVIKSHLSYSGIYEIFFAENGREGLLKAVMIQPDLILSDVEMPEVDGITMAQSLYILGWPLPLAFISSLNDKATIDRALNLKGIQGYLIKHEVLNDGVSFRNRVEKMLNILPSEKQLIRKSYQEIDLKRLDASNQKLGIFQDFV